MLKISRPRLAVVMGNGPSAKLLDFEPLRLGHIASVGMNAAYRYWDRIDFRPTYYICMDTVVILSHAERIAELIREGRIRKFFLRDEFKQSYPELADHDRVLWFSEVHGSEYPIFDTNLITTGSWAIRWMAYEGMRLIAAIGIDSNYVEILRESKRLGQGTDLTLEITRTPDFNPNYFFADYQQAGDRYNIPNDPAYHQKSGQLVHIEALRKADEDIKKLGMDVRILDCSPLSGHGVFEKLNIRELLAGMQFPLITSFHFAAPPDEVESNLRTAIRNCSNPFISTVLILFEGECERLESRVSEATMCLVRELENSKRLQFIAIDSRPNYLTLFEKVKSTGARHCVVANADIEIGYESAADILMDRFLDRSFVLALTRWNLTPNGLYLQGVAASPPWAEIPSEKTSYPECNDLSYDTYVCSSSQSLPPLLSDIYIGTPGCDTALVALFRINGTPVLNSCLSHIIPYSIGNDHNPLPFKGKVREGMGVKTSGGILPHPSFPLANALPLEGEGAELMASLSENGITTHADSTVRSYSDEAGLRQMLHNTNVVKKALLDRYANCQMLFESLNGLDQLKVGTASFGTPHRLGAWHSLFRLLGTTHWSSARGLQRIQFVRISIDANRLPEIAEEAFRKIEAAIESNAFMEIEVSGGEISPHYLGVFGNNPLLNELRGRLYRYNWQTVIHLEHATEYEKKIHADILLILKELLGMSPDCTEAGTMRSPDKQVPQKVADDPDAGSQLPPDSGNRIVRSPGFENDPNHVDETSVLHNPCELGEKKLSGESHPKAANSMAVGVPKDTKVLNESSNMPANLNSYIRFAEWVKGKNPALFSIGQFVMWVLRYLKRHALAAFCGGITLFALIAAPIRFPQLAEYEVYFWITTVLLVFIVTVVIGTAFVRMKVQKSTERESITRGKL